MNLISFLFKTMNDYNQWTFRGMKLTSKVILFVSVSIAVRMPLRNVKCFDRWLKTWAARWQWAFRPCASWQRFFYAEVSSLLIKCGNFLDACWVHAKRKISRKGLTNLSVGVCRAPITQVVCVLKWKARGTQGQREKKTHKTSWQTGTPLSTRGVGIQPGCAQHRQSKPGITTTHADAAWSPQLCHTGAFNTNNEIV